MTLVLSQKLDRLVAREFEEDILFESDSPTCGNESLRIVMAIIAQKGWLINSMDIKKFFFKEITWKEIS